MVRIAEILDRELSARLAERSEGEMRSTYSLGMISGGHNTNVVPSRCTAQIDRRLLPSETVESAFAELCEIVASSDEPADKVNVTLLRGTNGFRGGTDGILVSSLSQAIESRTGAPARFTSAIGVSDGRYFSDDGIEIVNFGPGIGSEGHASNEAIELSAVLESALIQKDAIGDILGYAD
jgi:acetylornithine deacetylase/succinyl-diaminopimelate desuccinylase-like protein